MRLPSLFRRSAPPAAPELTAPVATDGPSAGTPADIDHDKLRILLSLLNEQSQPNINRLTDITRNLDILALSVKAMGYNLARQLAAELPRAPSTGARHVGVTSKLSTQADVESDWFAHWCHELRLPLIYHRKMWEFAWMMQAVFDHDLLRPGIRGLGFGCGTEPMPSYFSAHGMDVVMTDLPPEDARADDWATNNEYAASLEQAHHPDLVERDTFLAHVSRRHVDMNAIPADLTGFDLVWSICALEHLGSIEQGQAFVENAMTCLRPGGVAIHTTEFNINPEGPTIDNWLTVLFQRRHIEQLVDRLRAAGHRVLPIDFDAGSKPLDQFIDLPPWHDGTLGHVSRWLGQPAHLKVAIDGFPCTCIGLVVTKAA